MVRTIAIFVMLLPLAGAVATGVALPVLLMMCGLVVLALFAAGARNRHEP